MLGTDEVRRNALIELIRKLAKRACDYSANIQNLGIGVAMTPTAQSTTFSDNMAVSFPLVPNEIQGAIGNKSHTYSVEAAAFFNHLLAQIIITVWDGLKLGLLIRGGITIGRLIHDKDVIVGEALVTAVELEKSTKFPRIEIADEIIDLLDNRGQPIVDDYIKKECLEQVDGKWYVKSLALHIGYWRDHNWYRKQQGKEPEEIPVALVEIRRILDNEYKWVSNNGTDSVCEKWEWFMNKFEDSFQSGNWHLISGAREAACPNIKNDD